MEDNVKKELDTIETMVSRWKNNHMSFITGENDDFLLDELIEEIETTYVYSYVCNLREMGHINHQEASEFMGRCYEQAKELKEAIDKARK
jgi:predicted alpha/beta hydrolase family esterase